MRRGYFVLLIVCLLSVFSHLDFQYTGHIEPIGLKNLKALQSSADETWCEPNSTNTCCIDLPNGGKIEGVGTKMTCTN